MDDRGGRGSGPQGGRFDGEELLREWFEGDLELMAEVGETFLACREEMLARLRGALAGGDAEEAARAAHSFKGAVGNFGLEADPFRLARQIEEAARQGEIARAVELLEPLERMTAALASDLQSFLAARAPDLTS